uniref:Reverse transcriptase Ty1/copia-type domain-containing protein n=1 Tax=Fagus sylvatica TaxID=28930 RepID=A0A2N9J336_FAGSY
MFGGQRIWRLLPARPSLDPNFGVDFLKLLLKSPSTPESHGLSCHGKIDSTVVHLAGSTASDLLLLQTLMVVVVLKLFRKVTKFCADWCLFVVAALLVGYFAVTYVTSSALSVGLYLPLFPQALFHSLSYLWHCPRPKSGRRATKKLIHHQRDTLPPSNLLLLDSNHDTSAAVGKISESSTQPRKNRPHPRPDAPSRAAQISDAVKPFLHTPHAPAGLHKCHVSPFRSATLALDHFTATQRHPPKQQKDETEDAFTLRLEDWDGVNHQIITWLSNTSTPSVSMEFGGYDTAKDDPGERITAFHNRMRFLWDQLAASEPVIRFVSDAKLVSAHRECLRLHQPHTIVLATPASVGPTVTTLPRGHDKRRSNQKNSHLICAFCKNHDYTIDRCNMRACILQRSATLTASGSITLSDAAYFDLVSLTTLTYNIADLHALFNQILSCCNYVMDNPHLISAYTPLVLPTITTVNGSAMTDSRTGQITGTARKIGRLFKFTSLHFPSSSVSAPVIAASASIELWHSRLGHVSLPCIKTLVSRGLLGSVSSNAFDCMPCHLGKQPTLPFNNSESIASATFDLIHSNCIPSTDALHLSFRTKHYMNGCLAQPQTTVYSRLILYLISFPEIPSTSTKSVNPISDESPFADPTSNESLTADPTFDESPLSAPVANPVNTTAPEPRRSHRTGTWDLVDLPAGKSAIGCKWVYTIKTRSDGTVDRYKARLVANGFTQEYGINYEETFGLVARLSSVRTLIALPPGFSHPPSFSHKVCHLRQILYGLKQAPRAWFAMFSSTISQHGFSASSYDSTLFFRRSNHGITLLLMYVDDMIITGDDVQGIQDLKRFLAKYTSDLISQAEITDSKIVDTPIEYNNHLNTHDGEPLPDATLYRQLVGSLVYLTVTRLDISYAIHIISQFMAAPRSLHYAVVLRILRYLKGTLFHGLHFSS